MARGPKKHLKRIHAPKHWMLDKMGGVFAPRPSCGPHKLRECIPLSILLRNRLKYALNNNEVTRILQDRTVAVDGKIRTDSTFPAGFMDVVSIPKTGDLFRLLFDAKGRYRLHRISPEEATFKLCKVKRHEIGSKGIPYLVTHDGRTLRFPSPDIKVFDTIKLNLETNEIEEHVKCEVGSLVMVTAGHSMGRVGIIQHREKHDGAIDMVYVRDLRDHTFATRLTNVFVIGKHKEPLISLPKHGGVRLSVQEEYERRVSRKK